jgi:hypothetical protein
MELSFFSSSSNPSDILQEEYSKNISFTQPNINLKEYSLYILYIENNKIIIHLSQKDTDNNFLLKECSVLYYPITKLEILNKIQIESLFEIDMYVKKYMKEYGIENVRGGSYSNKLLDERNIEIIKKEISIEITIDNLLKKCCSVLNYSILTDLEWLLEFIINKDINIKKEYVEKYKKILEILNYYIPQIEESLYVNGEKDLSVLIKKPQFIYDNFFYHRKNLLNEQNKKNYKQMVETAIKLTSFYIEYFRNKSYSS